MTENNLGSSECLAAEKLRRLAWPVFQEFPHIRQSLESLKNSEAFTARVRSFDQALAKTNEILSKGEVPDNYKHLKRFSELWGNESIPSLNVALSDREQFIQASRMAFEHAKENYPEWANSEYKSSYTSAIGIFLMGYGYYLGLRKTGSDSKELAIEIGLNFDHGIEEVLVMNFPESPILKDVGDWILEERSGFSEEIANRLERINK